MRFFSAYVSRISTLLPLICLLLSVSGPYCRIPFSERSGPVDRSDYPLKIKKVRGSVYLVEDGNYWQTNSVYYANNDQLLFFDATYLPKTAGRVIWKAMASGYGEFGLILVTSHHIHRTGGLLAFREQGIPIVSLLETDRLMRARWPDMLREMQSFQSWINPPRVEVDRAFTFEIGEKKDLIKDKIQVIYPGHAWSKDNLAVYFVEERILYAGSLISDPLYFQREVSSEGMVRAMDELLKLDFDLVLCGHGSPECNRNTLIRLRNLHANAEIE